jgi:hypothetical protein
MVKIRSGNALVWFSTPKIVNVTISFPRAKDAIGVKNRMPAKTADKKRNTV